MISTILQKSWKDLKARKARTFFTLLTICLAVSSIGLFAVMPNMSDAMQIEVKDSNLHDVKLSVKNINLTDTQINEIRELPNVNAVEVKSAFKTRMYIGERRADVKIIGMGDMEKQEVDIVRLDSGSDPGNMQLLSDVGNHRANLFSMNTGDNIQVFDHQGNVVELEMVGKGHCLQYTDEPSFGTAVFYTDMATVHKMANTSGVNSISLDLDDVENGYVQDTITLIEEYLKENTDFVAFTDLPDIREVGDYPFKSTFEDIMSFFYVLTLMTTLCSLFLISNTMHTMITEQREEIARLKAIGATKLQVLRSYITTSTILGSTGSILGSILGVIIAYLVGKYLFNAFCGLNLPFTVHIPVLILSVLLGVSVTIIASLPALRKGMKTSVREGMEKVGIGNGHTNNVIDRMLKKVGMIPRSAQMGMRNITRKRGRSISTIIQVALAVGVFFGFVAIGYTVPAGITKIFDDMDSDIMTFGHTSGATPLTEDMEPVLMEIDGVAEVDPCLYSDGFLGEQEFEIEAFEHDSFIYLFENTLQKGRWFNQEECQEKAKVIVLNHFLAEKGGVTIGDEIDIILATGTYTFKVIGLDAGFGDWGMTAYMPLDTLQDVLYLDNIVAGFGIRTTSQDRDLIDRVSTEIEDMMLSRGYIVDNNIMYMELEEQIQFNKGITDMMIAVGTLIVFISLIGLMSTLTMNVVERTKEIGMLRCIGATSRSLRTVFGVEGLTLALVGWLVGIPVGYGVASFLNLMIYELMDCDFALFFPRHIIYIAGGITVILTLVVIQPPLWRATHLRPGDALRHQ